MNHDEFSALVAALLMAIVYVAALALPDQLVRSVCAVPSVSVTCGGGR